MQTSEAAVQAAAGTAQDAADTAQATPEELPELAVAAGCDILASDILASAITACAG
jgi:hypothetical protein